MKQIPNTSTLRDKHHESDVRNRCHHPNAGAFTPFTRSAISLSIWDRFHYIANLHADRTAVVTPVASFTYRTLSNTVDHIVHLLVKDSHCGDSTSQTRPVALLLGNDIHFYAAMLAAIKLGRPYLALDDNLPEERISYMLEDSGASTIVSSKLLACDLNQFTEKNISVLFIEDALNPGISLESGCEIPKTTQYSKAMVIYTSGSTGQPKGFIHRHRNVLHDAMHYTNSGRFCFEDRFMLLASLSFADSVRTIFSALLNGAALYPVNIKDLGFHNLADYIQDNSITIYRSVPTLFRHFAATLKPTTQFPNVRLIYLSGEPVYRPDFQLYQRHFSSSCILVNRIGSGEGFTFRCNFMDKNSHFEGSNVPVGYEVVDKEIRLLDETGNSIDLPGVGEIAVHSEFLCDGYLNKPIETENTFLPGDPSNDARLYRTGDLGEIREDGCLIHLGRKDFQIKVRGYRVELGEIETMLMEHPAVKEAVAVASQNDNFDVSLIAFVTAQQSMSLTTNDLTEYLVTRLPDYLIPTHISVTPELPQTTTGKVDRKALSNIASQRFSAKRVDAETHFPPPAESEAETNTETQDKLSRIWKDVLGVERIGIHDDFLQLGGNSLMAMRIIALVSSEFQISISYRELLMDASNIAQMSHVIDQAT